MVIWVTGLSGSGKTTLCNAIWKLLKPRLPELVCLDGDAVRIAFGGGLGYREEDRVVQITRIQGLAKVLSDQDLVILVAALYYHPDLSAWNRDNIKDYFEVYLETSIEAVRERDTKGLYEKAITGVMKDVVGVDIPWHVPQAPDLVINNNHPRPAEELARQVIAAVPGLTLGQATS